MLAGRFDYKTAAGLHRDRLAEAESIRRARYAKTAVKAAKAARASIAEQEVRIDPAPLRILRRKIGKQLIALGERIAAA